MTLVSLQTKRDDDAILQMVYQAVPEVATKPISLISAFGFENAIADVPVVESGDFQFNCDDITSQLSPEHQMVLAENDIAVLVFHENDRSSQQRCFELFGGTSHYVYSHATKRMTPRLFY